METARIEAELDIALSSDNSCSVLWLVPESDPQDLASTMTVVTEHADMMVWGFIGAWERSKFWESRAADIDRLSRGSAECTVGDTRVQAQMLALPVEDQNWFWAQFGTGMRPYQICAVLMPVNAQLRGWTYAALQLVLSAAARQVRPGASYQYVLRFLQQAFLSEVIAAGGIAATRLRAELLQPGIALTSTSELIGSVSAPIADARAIDPLLTERSRLLSGNW